MRTQWRKAVKAKAGGGHGQKPVAQDLGKVVGGEI